jgi:hypothetical protein
MDTVRNPRLEAFHGAKAMTAELRGTKLHDDEAAVIVQAAEDLLLAGSPDDPYAQESLTAFRTLLADLLAHRWDEHVRTADRLRSLVEACAPDRDAVTAG